jgi:ketosteroid isomerase-like protein
MSRENVEVIEGLYRTFNQRDMTGLLDLLHSEVEWVPVLAVLEGHVYHGHDGVRRWMKDLGTDWESFELFYDEIRDLGDQVLVFGHWRARGRTSGGESEQPGTWLYELERGKVMRLRTFTNPDEAREAVGLSE